MTTDRKGSYHKHNNRNNVFDSKKKLQLNTVQTRCNYKTQKSNYYCIRIYQYAIDQKN